MWTVATPMALELGMGLMAGLSMVLYGKAFEHLGSPDGLWYFARMAFHPLFLAGAGLQGVSALVVRFLIFDAIGVTRTVIISPFGFLGMVFLIALVFKEPMGARQLLGGLIILLGVVLVAR